MGFFSWDCKGCGHSIREGRGWMGKAVVQGSDGDTASGRYDGYGRLDGSVGTVEVADLDGSFAMWHQTCFKLMGRPSFTSVSGSANDQGMPPADEFPEPRSVDDLRALKELAEERLRKDRAAAKRYAECREAEHEVIGSAAKCPHCRFDTFYVVERNGVLMIRCPNRDCARLRPFPVEKATAWRALAEKFADQPVIWDDRRVGPHFGKVESARETLARYEEERKLNDQRSGHEGYAESNKYLSERVAALTAELAEATAQAEAAEAAEVIP